MTTVSYDNCETCTDSEFGKIRLTKTLLGISRRSFAESLSISMIMQEYVSRSTNYGDYLTPEEGSDVSVSVGH